MFSERFSSGFWATWLPCRSTVWPLFSSVVLVGFSRFSERFLATFSAVCGHVFRRFRRICGFVYISRWVFSLCLGHEVALLGYFWPVTSAVVFGCDFVIFRAFFGDDFPRFSFIFRRFWSHLRPFFEHFLFDFLVFLRPKGSPGGVHCSRRFRPVFGRAFREFRSYFRLLFRRFRAIFPPFFGNCSGRGCDVFARFSAVDSAVV